MTLLPIAFMNRHNCFSWPQYQLPNQPATHREKIPCKGHVKKNKRSILPRSSIIRWNIWLQLNTVDPLGWIRSAPWLVCPWVYELKGCIINHMSIFATILCKHSEILHQPHFSYAQIKIYWNLWLKIQKYIAHQKLDELHTYPISPRHQNLFLWNTCPI